MKLGTQGNFVVYRVADTDPKEYSVWFWCPGCDEAHAYRVAPNRWAFNGDYERPTFTPSLLVRGSKSDRCHLFVTDGRIRFCGDSHHALAGQTVDVPRPPDWLIQEGQDRLPAPEEEG